MHINYRIVHLGAFSALKSGLLWWTLYNTGRQRCPLTYKINFVLFHPRLDISHLFHVYRAPASELSPLQTPFYFPEIITDITILCMTILMLPWELSCKESACNAGEPSSIPGSGRSAGEGIGCPLQYSWASLVAQLVKNPPAMQQTWVWSLGWEDPLEKGKATHSSLLAWRIP